MRLKIAKMRLNTRIALEWERSSDNVAFPIVLRQNSWSVGVAHSPSGWSKCFFLKKFPTRSRVVGDGARGPNSTCPIDLARGGGLIRTGGGTILWGPRAPRPLSPKPPGAAGSANGESAIENGASAVENCENAVENGESAVENS